MLPFVLIGIAIAFLLGDDDKKTPPKGETKSETPAKGKKLEAKPEPS